MTAIETMSIDYRLIVYVITELNSNYVFYI